MKYSDVTGKTFGELLILETLVIDDRPYSKRRVYYRVQCSCKTIELMYALQLSKRTECRRCYIWHDRVSLLGNRYGQLTVIVEAEPRIENGRVIRTYLCQCTCGNTEAFENGSRLKRRLVFACKACRSIKKCHECRS